MRVLIKLDPPKVRVAALISPEVRKAVGDSAERMAAAARSKTTNEIEVIHAGNSRARSYVRLLGADGAAQESAHRPLGSSIDAGRI